MEEERMIPENQSDEIKEERSKLKNESKEWQNLNNENEKLKQEIVRLRIDNTVDKILYEVGAINNATVKPLLDFSEILSLDDNSKVELIKAQVKKLAVDESTAFLFKSAQKPHFVGAVPDEGRDGLPNVNYSDGLSTAIAKHIFK